VLHYRKNVNGSWEVCSLRVDEVKAIQNKIVQIGFGLLVDIRKQADEHNKAIDAGTAKEGATKISLTEEATAVILAKVMPSYESLANDYIEAQIKKKLEGKPQEQPAQK
jgi:translation elongation factor EF-1beta